MRNLKEAGLDKLLSTMLKNSSLATSLETISSLISSISARDSYTFHHSTNVGYYAWNIAKQMGMDEEQCTSIYIGGLLHDIGKIGTPDSVLLKEGKLTNEEFAIMKNHTVIGFDIVKFISPFQKRAIDKIVLYHHERLDGKGYPEGLFSNEIPVEAKIIAVADSYDAMTSNRHYRPSLSHEQAVEQLLVGKGTQFDPFVVDIFLESTPNRSIRVQLTAN